MSGPLIATALAVALTVAPGCAHTGVEEGKAAWYGPGLHGRTTASGERFDMQALTAAHPTLPFGAHPGSPWVTTGWEECLHRRLWPARPWAAGPWFMHAASRARGGSTDGVAPRQGRSDQAATFPPVLLSSLPAGGVAGRQPRVRASSESRSTHAKPGTTPFGTRVRVTNLRNGRTVIVRVNDRGRFAHGRVIDLSREAAVRLGMIADGVVPVKLEVVERVR